MRQALLWACVSCRAGLLVTSFPSHAAREGRGGAPCSQSLSRCRSGEADTPAQVPHGTSLDSQCGQGALLPLMQRGFLPNLVGGAEHPHSSLHPSDTHPTRTWGVSPSWWVGVVFTDVSEMGHRLFWCFLERGGHCANIVRPPRPCPLATESRAFVVVLFVACITFPDCLYLRLQA